MPKEVAEAIEAIRDMETCGLKWECKPIRLLDKDVLRVMEDDYAQIIMIYLNESIENTAKYYFAVTQGYEEEQTPEEELAYFYNEILASEIPLYGPDKLSLETVKNARLQAIRDTLNILNIKIQGVNDNA